MGGVVAAAAAAGGALAVQGLMSALSNATLTAYAPVPPKDGKGAPTKGSQLWEMKFEYNPKELSYSKSAKWKAAETQQGGNAPPATFIGTESGSRTIELFHSLVEPMSLTTLSSPLKDLGDIKKKLESLCEAHPDLPKDKPKYTPFVVFSWGGETSNPCFCESVDIKHLMFLPNGKPVRMSATLKLTEATKVLGLTNPTSGGRTNRKVHTLLAGETLATVAFKELQNAALWRAIAEENGIDDPMRLTPGTELLLPEPMGG